MDISADILTDRRRSALTIDRLAAPDIRRMRFAWELCADVFAGEMAVKAKGDRYIYKPVSKSGTTTAAKKAWEAYKGRGKLSKIPRQTLEKITGTLTAKPPQVLFGDRAAAVLAPLVENATPFGDGLDALFSRTVYNVLKSGRYCLLLEPEDNASAGGFHINEYRAEKFLRAVSAVDETGRSYARMVLLDTSSIDYDLSEWRSVYRPSLTVLGLDAEGRYYQAIIRSAPVAVRVEDAPGVPVFESERDRRESEKALVEALRLLDVDAPQPNGLTEIVYPTKYGRTLDRIPFTVCNPGDLNFARVSEPPLLDVCLLALHALEADCDHQQAIFLTTDPLPVFSGLDERGGADGKPINLTPDRSLKLTGNAKFDFVAAPAQGLQMQADNIKNMLDEARLLSLAVSGMEDTGNTSGVALELKQEYRTADIRLINQTCAKAVEEQMRCAGRWLGMDAATAAEEIKYTPSRDLARMKPTLSDAKILADVAARFSLTRQELREWAEANLGIEHRDFDEVLAALDAEAVTSGTF